MAVSGSAVRLSLVDAVGIGKTVTVSYTAPESQPIQDRAGSDAAGFTNESVTVTGICNRTPAVRTDLLERIAGVTDCASVTSEHLGAIDGELSFSNQRISSLQANDFAGLSKLQRIYFPNDLISSLDANIFAGLSNLKHMRFSNNSISSLDANIFAGLSKLEYISFNDNSISSLDAEIFAGLSNLEAILFTNNSIGNLDADIFDGLSNLRQISFVRNSLKSLPEGIFSSERNLTALAHLYLRENDLVCLPSDFPYSKVEDGSLEVDVDLPDCFGVSLSVSPTVVREGSEWESITVTAALMAGEPRINQRRAKSEDTTVTISVVSGTAEEGTDFEAVSSFSLTVAAGSTSQTGTFTLTATADDEPEEPETVTVTGATALSDSSVAGTQVDGATIEIRDALGVSISPTSLSVEESGTTTYTVVLINEPSGTVTVTPSSNDIGAATFSPSGLT
ncbi:MAG: hypothetical protein TE42_08460, partial [Candidatus Synechococcus spongiarum SP3]